MKKKPLNKKALSKLVIDVNELGFTIWTEEKIGKTIVRHWIIDASCIKEDVEIRIGNEVDSYKYSAETTDNGITLIQKK